MCYVRYLVFEDVGGVVEVVGLVVIIDADLTHSTIQLHTYIHTYSQMKLFPNINMHQNSYMNQFPAAGSERSTFGSGRVTST